MFQLAQAELAAPNVRVMRLRGDTEGAGGPGRFVEVSVPGFFLRRPFSVCGCEGDELTIVVKLAGRGTEKLLSLEPARSSSCSPGSATASTSRSPARPPSCSAGAAAYRRCST